MSSGRSGAPGGRSGPEPSLDPQRQQSAQSGGAGQPISDLPALPFDSLPPVGRMPFDASERGYF
ncbi:MAG TPA: hypothetical protein VIC27_10520, partial [Ktedonobacterales bacterium]